jgi:hypothetical protein
MFYSCADVDTDEVLEDEKLNQEKTSGDKSKKRDRPSGPSLTPENGQEEQQDGEEGGGGGEEKGEEEPKRAKIDEERMARETEHEEKKEEEDIAEQPEQPVDQTEARLNESNVQETKQNADVKERIFQEQPLEIKQLEENEKEEQGNEQQMQQHLEQPEQPKQHSSTESIEQGRIMFFYRPKVGIEEASSIQDIQRFYMLLAPAGGGRPRLAVVGKKRLPAVETHERFFGFIEAVGDSVEDLVSGLGEKQYETKTRGTRHIAAARIVAEGTYAIVERGGPAKSSGRTHLIIKPNVPSQQGAVQEELHIPPKAGSYSFSVKNPSNEPRPGGAAIGLEQKAEYTEEKREEFGGYAWIGVSDPSLLEFERCEFLLVAATEDVEQELGAPAEEFVYKRPECLNMDEECLIRAMKEEVQDEKQVVNTEPAQTGQWA